MEVDVQSSNQVQVLTKTVLGSYYLKKNVVGAPPYHIPLKKIVKLLCTTTCSHMKKETLEVTYYVTITLHF
jgi:hypothetical protein